MTCISTNSIKLKSPHIADGVTSMMGNFTKNIIANSPMTLKSDITGLKPDVKGLNNFNLPNPINADVFGVPRIGLTGLDKVSQELTVPNAKLIKNPVKSKPKIYIPRIGLTGLDKIHQNLSRIFEKIRPVSKAEAEAMARRYQEILKTEDHTEYITKLFEQVKQDFGYGENKNIFLKINDDPKCRYLGCFYRYSGELSIKKHIDRESILNAMFHEFTHVKQEEIMLRTKGAKEKYAEMHFEDWQEQIPNNNPEDSLKFAQKHADDIFGQRRMLFGDLPEFPEESILNIWGKQYVEADFNYLDDSINHNRYRKNLLEQEAYRNGELAKEIFDSIGGRD